MTEEKQLILNMLKEGKITVEEASDLLEAIGDKKSPINDFTGKISSTVDSILKKATETISAFDIDTSFDLSNIPNYNLKGEINSHKDMRVDDEIEKINIDVVNGNIVVEKNQEPGIIISADVYAKQANLEDFIEVEIKDGVLNIEENNDYSETGASVNLKVSLGSDFYEKLFIDTINARVEVCDVDFENLEINSVNGKITLINLKSNVDIDNVNGKVDIKNVEGDVRIDNISGSIYLADIKGEIIDVDNISGNIRVDSLKSKSLKAETKSGSIRLYNIDGSKEIDLETTSGTLVIDTNNYKGQIRAFAEGPSVNVTDKFVNKIKTDEGYEISTSNTDTDLEIRARASSGKISIR